MKKGITLGLLTLLMSTSAFANHLVTVTVKGMVCSFCAQGITKKFNTEDAVRKVDVSLKDHLVSLEVKEGKELTDASIDKILKDAGYTVEKIERK